MQTTTCTCTEGFEPCEITAERRCFICDAPLCAACARAVYTKGGLVYVCSCGANVCFYALRLGEHLRAEALRVKA